MMPGSKKKVLFEGKLYSNQSVDLNMKKYSYLVITYCLYDYQDSNTGGSSNVMIIDLTKKADKFTNYQTSKRHPYNIFNNTKDSCSGSMDAACEVNASKTNLKAFFAYNGAIQPSTVTMYYISKIVGIK